MSNKAVDIVQDYLDKNSVTQGALAEALGLSRITVNLVLNGRMNVTANFALRFEKYSGIAAEKLVYAQADHDLDVARSKIAKFKKAKRR